MVLHRVVIRTAFAVGAIILGYQSVCTALELHEEQPESTPFDYAVAIADRHRNAAVAVIETYCPAPLATQCLAVANEIRLTDYSAFLDALARLEVTVAPVVAYGRGLPLSSCTRFGILAIVLAAAYLASLYVPSPAAPVADPRSLFQRHCQLFATLVALVLAVTASSRGTSSARARLPLTFLPSCASRPANRHPTLWQRIATDTLVVRRPYPYRRCPSHLRPRSAYDPPCRRRGPDLQRARHGKLHRWCVLPRRSRNSADAPLVSYSMLDAILEIADSLAPVDQVVTVAALAAPFSGTDFSTSPSPLFLSDELTREQSSLLLNTMPSLTSP